MGRKKKPFIDKKNATTYRLVHRSQQDPLIADETANQMVLDEVQPAEKQRRDQVEHGIYFEDDYDYMQHLRERSSEEAVVWEAANPTNPGKVVLPVCVLPSVEEEPVGMLNLAAPRGLDLSLDPDIVAALDDDFDFEDPSLELEDNFMDLAEGVIPDQLGEILEEEGSEEDYGSEEDDEVDSNFSGARSDDEFESRECRFTEYSMSSSVLPRSEGLALLDDKFENLFAEYDELGAGEEELKPIDEAPTQPNLILEQLCDEFERNNLSDEETTEDLKKRTLALYEKSSNREPRKETVPEDVIEKVPWDCETILSTYSNVYNHPKLIPVLTRHVKINKKGMAENELDEGVDVSADEEEEEKEEEKEGEETIQISNLRTKSETLEEKKARKKAVKEAQRARRQIKKATKEVFRDENSKEYRMMANKPAKTIKL